MSNKSYSKSNFKFTMPERKLIYTLIGESIPLKTREYMAAQLSYYGIGQYDNQRNHANTILSVFNFLCENHLSRFSTMDEAKETLQLFDSIMRSARNNGDDSKIARIALTPFKKILMQYYKQCGYSKYGQDSNYESFQKQLYEFIRKVQHSIYSLPQVNLYPKQKKTAQAEPEEQDTMQFSDNNYSDDD